MKWANGRGLLPVLVCLLFVPAASACKCDLYTACNEVGATNLVFIGTVESIAPQFLNRWSMPTGEALRHLNDIFYTAQEHPTEQNLANLRAVYLETFPSASNEFRSKLVSAKTASAISSAFYAEMGRGIRIHLRVQTLFKQEKDEDDAPPKKPAAKDDDDAKAKPESFDIWTPFDDCGFTFQTGETYLVYASDDEESTASYWTSSCTRTRRISDAGEDLSYLYFYKEHPDSAGRVEAFTTTNRRYRLGFDPLHPETLKDRSPGVIVELASDRVLRHIESDTSGRAVFDGLPEGDYKLSAYGPGYPMETHLLTGPQNLHVEKRSCSIQVLLLPQEETTKQN